jgi:hypothetical protein
MYIIAKMAQMKYLFLHFLTIMCLSVLLTGCDPLSLLDVEPQFKDKKSTQELPPWVCVRILEPNRYIFTGKGQMVTVTLAHVVVPAIGTNAANNMIRSRTEISPHKLESVAREVHHVIEETLDQKHCALEPEPVPGQSEMETVVVLASGIDFNAFLVKYGMALTDPAAGTNMPGVYNEFQLRAIDFGKGIWSAPVRINDRFTIDCSAFIRRFEEGRGLYNVPDTLRRFHSPDLIRAPRYVMDSNSETESSTDMECSATVTVIASGPPKEYDVSISFRPTVSANEYSGPLESFKPLEMNWEKDGFYIRGGETNTLTIMYDPLELTRVIRGAGIEVYSGYLITGYEIQLSSEEKVLYTTSGTLDPALTLKELEASSSGLF